MSEFIRDPQAMAVVAATAAVIADGYEGVTYWHPGHAACASTGNADPLALYVPLDKTGWSGVTCGQCGLQLQAF